MLVWHAKVWPMESTRQNILYMANEYLYLACCFYTMAFTEYNSDPQVRFSQGWFYLGFIGLIVLGNIVVLGIDLFIGVRDYCRKRKQKKLEQKIEQDKKVAKALADQKSIMEFPARS